MIHLYHGRVRNKMLYINHLQKLSIVPWVWLLMILFGCVRWLLAYINVYLKDLTPLLLLTLFLMSEPSILKQVTILM